jgi:uncharacterized protein (DUF2235 family)
VETDENGNEECIEQIIYYQKGVGTGILDSVVGGATGIGVSDHVRAAYGFLAHNYNEGDQIYFFGFSRGAFTARAVAGLVTAVGLLTKQGMDSFSELYKLYYKDMDNKQDTVKPEVTPKQLEFYQKLQDRGLIHAKARYAVEIVGVWVRPQD